MPDFIVRVELHAGADYDTLHRTMERAGFRRMVSCGLFNLQDSRIYHLPDAEYHLSRSMTLDEVIDLARLAACAVYPDPRILAMQAAALRCHNLKPF